MFFAIVELLFGVLLSTHINIITKNYKNLFLNLCMRAELFFILQECNIKVINFKLLGVLIEIRFFFVAVLTYMLFADKNPLVIYGFFSSIIHECSHLLFMYLFNEKPEKIIFTFYGIRIEKRESIYIWKEVLILLAGPIINILIFIIFFPLRSDSVCGIIAAYNLILGLFNMLPIGGLDGGRILNLVLLRICGARKADIISKAISVIILFPVAVMAFYLFINDHNNITLLMLAIFMMLTCFTRAANC